MLEAFASNIPVITSNVTSLPEVSGDAAILIDPYSTDDISAAMEKIAGDTLLHQQLQNKGRERVKLFSWERTAKLTAEVYEKMV